MWERWTQEARVRARARRHLRQPGQGAVHPAARLSRAATCKWKGGPSFYGKKIINPQSAKIAQSIETHIEVFAPGGYGQKHGHMNSAVFYVLKGKGHDVHDGRRMDWEAGDALIVENACVHQHFNDEPDDESIVLVMKAKPLFLFMHMLFQKVAEFPPKDATAEAAGLHAADGSVRRSTNERHRSARARESPRRRPSMSTSTPRR